MSKIKKAVGRNGKKATKAKDPADAKKHAADIVRLLRREYRSPWVYPEA